MLAIARFHHTDRSEDRLSILELTITVMFTPLIAINIAPLTVLFCNWVMFYNCLLLKGISFNTKFLLVSCEKTRNHMLGSDDIRDHLPSWFLKILKLSSFYSGIFKIFKKAVGQFLPNRSPKNMITSTNCYEKHLLCQISSQAFIVST